MFFIHSFFNLFILSINLYLSPVLCLARMLCAQGEQNTIEFLPCRLIRILVQGPKGLQINFSEYMNFLKEHAKMSIFIFQEDHLSLYQWVPLGGLNTEKRVNPDP